LCFLLQFHVPVAVTLTSQASVSDANPWVRVKVTNLLGDALGPAKVTIDSAKRVGEGSSVDSLAKTSLSPVQGDQYVNMTLRVNFHEN
jgi:hypothetical protein